MEIKTVILIVVIGFILFEVIEHIGIPIFFYFMKRRGKSVIGIESLLGEVVEIRQWNETAGQVFVKGELWKAFSDASFIKGDKAIIQNVKGLTLQVTPIGDILGKSDSEKQSNQ